MRKKSVKKGETKSRRVMLNLTESQHRDLLARAERFDLSPLDYIRHILFDELNPLIEKSEVEKETLEAELQLAKVRLKCLEEELNIERSRDPIELDERARIRETELERQQEFLEHSKKMLRLEEERIEVKKLERRLLTGQFERRASKKETIADVVSSLKD